MFHRISLSFIILRHMSSYFATFHPCSSYLVTNLRIIVDVPLSDQRIAWRPTKIGFPYEVAPLCSAVEKGTRTKKYGNLLLAKKQGSEGSLMRIYESWCLSMNVRSRQQQSAGNSNGQTWLQDATWIHPNITHQLPHCGSGNSLGWFSRKCYVCKAHHKGHKVHKLRKQKDRFFCECVWKSGRL